eukprot:TRINITY_DN7633_c0_g1_i2.p1 TRINITY_DN7633_c0_g1~~TRINITY_DN7633_c0_g1_i2.p1  ORF type:complete len:245 (-),score=28.93 TRINITY_DN7633_c0_g1_i2:188-922(-)
MESLNHFYSALKCEQTGNILEQKIHTFHLLQDDLFDNGWNLGYQLKDLVDGIEKKHGEYRDETTISRQYATEDQMSTLTNACLTLLAACSAGEITSCTKRAVMFKLMAETFAILPLSLASGLCVPMLSPSHLFGSYRYEISTNNSTVIKLPQPIMVTHLSIRGVSTTDLVRTVVSLGKEQKCICHNHTPGKNAQLIIPIMRITDGLELEFGDKVGVRVDVSVYESISQGEKVCFVISSIFDLSF